MATPRVSIPAPIMSIATPLRDSNIYTTTKGLLNGPGQNNCFLNSAIQVLWHLDIFRKSFRDLSGHACMAESCIFCALKELFSELQFSPESALPPDALRKALAESYFDQQRFQLGFMDDAAECFENMLLRIHQHVAHGQAEDACVAPHCVPHQKFAMTLIEQALCGNCGATTEPLSYTQMVHYVSTSTLVYQVRANAARQCPQDTFGKLLQKAGSMGDIRQCPSACGSVIQIGRSLMNHPEIVSIGLVWNSERPTLEHIMEVFSSIGTTLRLNDVFNNVADSRWAEISIHNLVGVVTYYGKHYTTFFFHTKLRKWIYFDDATVREIGPMWDQVVEKCRKGRYQPLLLLYASPDGTPVNTDSAPKQVTPFYTDKTKSIPSQQFLRRSVTPSPEKPIISPNTRRAITPNPDSSAVMQKPPLPRTYNEYQNLSVIQKNIYPFQKESNSGFDEVDGCINKKPEPEYMTKNVMEFVKPQVNVHRTLSNGSSSGIEADNLNLPRRRDSGNWSGDRNSASSTSSTTMENPYFYLVGKVPYGATSVPGSPTRTKSESSSGNSAMYDAGYDSYSLSSNDSSGMTTIQHLMKGGHLAKIPEDYSNTNNQQPTQSCDALCEEADKLLVKSRQLEDEHDLVLALAICNAAATKARAAMNAPYNNPKALTIARMKHNTCIMRARSLHRRMTQTQNPTKENIPEIRHTREGSSGSGRHSRQNSKDKGQHSRQNSRELLIQQEKEKNKATKNLEIYATLPKKKDALRMRMNQINIEDAEYMMYDKPPERESRSIFSRSKNKDSKLKEKRSRSEDRNKFSRSDFSIAPDILTGKETLKKAKETKEKEEKKDKEGKSKKQHKIRRKLLMGGLIKRKNRSMPDLTDANDEESERAKTPSCTATSADDSSVGLKGNVDTQSGMTGYLSEGHLEFSGANTNPNLERSKLMRKSFHSNATKMLTAAKVPPPPPLRTTSQLTASKMNASNEVNEENQQYGFSDKINRYNNQTYDEQSSMSLPYYHNNSNNNNSSFDDDSFPNPSSCTMVIQADVHREEKPTASISPPSTTDSGVDEIDSFPQMHSAPLLELPPYPSPMGSVIHSRQASEDFPPPPPPLDLSALEEHLPKSNEPESNSLLAQLQNKRHQILSQNNDYPNVKQVSMPIASSGNTWLKELQAKQAALRYKKTDNDLQNGVDEVNTQRYLPGEARVNSVKDLASKFENTDLKPALPGKIGQEIQRNGTVKYREQELAAERIAEEIREVEMITSAFNKALSGNVEQNEENKKVKLGKKKSVSFCDQVILVATAEEQEDDSFIPNPILERVLRTAMNKSEAAAIRQELLNLKEQNSINGQDDYGGGSYGNKSLTTAVPLNDIPQQQSQQSPYVRRNSLDNILNGQEYVGNHAQPVTTSYRQPCHTQQQINECNVMPDQQYSDTNSTNNFNNYQIYQPQNANQHQEFYQKQYSQHQYNAQNGGGQYIQNHNQNVDRSNYVSQNSNQYAYHQMPHEHNHHQSYGNEQKQHGVYESVQQHQQPNYIEQNTPYRQSPYLPVPQPHIPPVHQQHPPSVPPHPTQSGAQQQIQSMSQHHASSNPQNNYHQSVPHHSTSSVQYNNNRQQSVPENNGQTYSTTARPAPYSHTPMRQPTPCPTKNYPLNRIANNHTLSPVPQPSLQSNYNYHPSMYRGSPNQGVYQRVTPVNDYPVPERGYLQNGDYEYNNNQRSHNNDVYQRVPMPHGDDPMKFQQQQQQQYQQYHHQMPPAKQPLIKTTNSTDNMMVPNKVQMLCESPTPKSVMTPIIVNNSNNSVPTDKTKCMLCRKKNVAASNSYCMDCEFYLSKFKPRTS